MRSSILDLNYILSIEQKLTNGKCKIKILALEIKKEQYTHCSFFISILYIE